MRIVVDTNIIISGIFFGGKPRELLENCFSGKYQMMINLLTVPGAEELNI